MKKTILTGTVVAADTGRPLDAEVRICCLQGGRSERLVQRTSRNGGFQFRLSITDGTALVSVGVCAERYEEWTTFYPHDRVEIEAGKTEELIVELKSGPTVRGVVVDEDGKPISGVAVSVGQTATMYSEASRRRERTRFFEHEPVRTDRQGRFVIARFHFDEPEWQTMRRALTFHHPQYVSGAVQAIERRPQRDRYIDIDVVLSSGVAASGIVRFAGGQRLRGGTIAFTTQHNRPHEYGSTKQGEIDRRGRFHVPGLEPRVYTVHIVNDRCAAFQADDFLVGPGGVNKAAFEVEPARVLRGRLLDASGNPIAGRQLHSVTPDLYRSQVVTRRDGSFVFWGLPPGEEVYLSDRGVFVRRIGPDEDGVDVVAAGPHKMAFKAIDVATGKPPAEPFGLERRIPGLSIMKEFEPGLDTYDLGYVEAGEWELMVTGDRWLKTWRRVTLPLDGPAKPWVIRLRRGATITVTVVDDATGRPVRGAHVFAWGIRPGPRKHAPRNFHKSHRKHGQTDAAGKCRLRGIGPTSYRVLVTHPRYARHDQDGFVVKRGQKLRRLTVALARGGRIRGRVVNRSGAPVAGVLVQVTGARDQWRCEEFPHALTNETGEFDLSHIPPGDVFLHVNRHCEVVHVQNRRTTSVEVVLSE